MPPKNVLPEPNYYYVIDRDDGEKGTQEYVKITTPPTLLVSTISPEEVRSKNKSVNEELLRGGDDMLTFMAMLLITLVGVALAIFGVIATIVGLTWLLWPVIIAAIVLIIIGYRAGKKKQIEQKGEE